MSVVVGARGFLGRRLADALALHGSVQTIGRTTGSVIADLRSNTDLTRLCDLVAGEDVYYCANVGGRQAAEDDPASARLVNCVAPAHLAGVAKRFVYFSTDYVFSGEGIASDQTPVSPEGVYGRTKADGEAAVLAASASATVVRTSGLYDREGTRNLDFAKLTQVEAADNRTTNPTYVCDLIAFVVNGRQSAARIQHVVGPQTMSNYEFLQLASLAHSFDVIPTLESEQRQTTIASSGAELHSPAHVLLTAATAGPSPRDETVLVLDCVGVVLSGRRWRHPGSGFWDTVEANAEDAIAQFGSETVAAAYGPNPGTWRLLAGPSPYYRRILANNGPTETFERWVKKYGLDDLFDIVINSERDGLTKPSRTFRAYIEAVADGRQIRMIDDRVDIVEAARSWGWSVGLTRSATNWPNEVLTLDQEEQWMRR